MKKALLILIIFLVTGIVLLLNQLAKSKLVAVPVISEKPVTPFVKTESQFVLPVKNFREGITKKPFGIFITPQSSPVSPERFRGYHTGVDVEQDQSNDVTIPIYAITDGKIIYSGWVAGYGGVAGIVFSRDGKNYFAIYGHLNVDTILKSGAKVAKGEIIGYLGKGYSRETDFERRHLHFGIIAGEKFDLRGYVKNKEELTGWVDPVKFF